MECSMESILQSVMMCAQLGLEPILGRAYLVPYWNGKKRCLECQFQPGYQGLTDLARRSGLINDVYAQVVYENDFFDIEYGTSRKIVHKPCLNGEPGKPIGSYCVWEFKDGTKSFEFMPTHEINKRRNKSQSFSFAETGDPQKGGGKQDSVWHEWAEDMMRKTVVKHSSKLVPSSIEFMEAVMVDDAADTGRRVTMVQGVPMIENGLGASPLELKAPEPDEIFSEAFSKYAGLDYFEAFVGATMTANRCSRNEIVKAANQNPEAFIQTLTAWLKKRGGNGGAAVPPVEAEQGEPDSGKPKRTYTRRAKAEPQPEPEHAEAGTPQDPEAAEYSRPSRRSSRSTNARTWPMRSRPAGIPGLRLRRRWTERPGSLMRLSGLSRSGRRSEPSSPFRWARGWAV